MRLKLIASLIFVLSCYPAQAQTVRVTSPSQHPYRHMPNELNTIDTAADEECYTYEGDTAQGEWQTCGSGDVTDVGDCATGACFTGTTGNTLTFKGATSGTTALKPTAVAGTTTITMPAETGTMCTTGSVCSGYQASLSVSGTLATLTGDTISIKEGTLTDEKVCTYEATGTQLECNEAETGTGSIVRASSPSLTTPAIDVATGTSLDLTGTIGIGGAASGSFGIAVNGTTSPMAGASFVHTGASGAGGGAAFALGCNDSAAVVSGDRLGAIPFVGHDGSQYSPAATFGAFIGAFAEATWSNTSHPARLSFQTVATSATSLSERMRINSGGTVNVVGAITVGESAGSTATASMDIQAADNGTVIQTLINATQANVTASDTFIDFRSTTGSEGTIAGTAVAGVLAYNTFTGSHYSQIVDKTGLEVNMLLEIVDDSTPIIFGKQIDLEKTTPVTDEQTGEVTEKPIEYQASPKDQLFRTRISQTKGSKAAIGVYLGTDKEGRDMVGSIGTGFIWVANKGQNVSVGDYLIASDVLGAAELQGDDIYRSNTVAKITESVVWSDKETKRLVSCIYLGG